MSDNSNIIPLPRVRPDPFLADRARLTDLLIGYCLIESYHRFLANERPYPFATAAQLLPSQSQAWVEHRDQNTALMFLIDGTLPRPLNKHFRLRASNRVTWRNIQRLAPDLDLSGFKASHCRIDESLNDSGFKTLLQRLVALEWLANRDIGDGHFRPGDRAGESGRLFADGRAARAGDRRPHQMVRTAWR